MKGKTLQQRNSKYFKKYFKNLYFIKLEILKEIDDCLDSFKLQKLNQEEINNLNKPISKEEIVTVIKGHETKKKSRAKWIHNRFAAYFQ